MNQVIDTTADLKAWANQTIGQGLPRRLHDLECRITSLEKRVVYVVGFTAGISSVVGALVGVLLTRLFT